MRQYPARSIGKKLFLVLFFRQKRGGDGRRCFVAVDLIS
jgi:hypothetical protein